MVAQAAPSLNQCFPLKWFVEQFSKDNFFWFIVLNAVLVSFLPAASHRFVGHGLFLLLTVRAGHEYSIVELESSSKCSPALVEDPLLRQKHPESKIS